MVTVGILTSYHIYCITTNTTTIEGWEKGRSLTIKGMGKIQNVCYINRFKCNKITNQQKK